MPAWLAAAAAALGKIGISMIMSLLTEQFAKRLVVHSLEKVASWTESDWDNKVVADVKAQWGIE